MIEPGGRGGGFVVHDFFLLDLGGWGLDEHFFACCDAWPSQATYDEY
jgi:hypothetical protein